MMKFRLFPSALALLALASCSNDDLLSELPSIAQREAGKLYVQVEELQDGMNDASTRAGFVYSNDLNKSNSEYFAWTQGDKVKIYDDNKNWRTQEWEYSEASTLAYDKSKGFSVFEKINKVAGQATTEEGMVQYTNAYGVFPADLGKFTNEDRSEIEFNLSCLKMYSLDRAAVTEGLYNDCYLAKAPIPLWGVATSSDGSSEMKVKYLTGILKVDIAQLPATTGTNHNYLVINSMTAAPGGFGSPIDLHPESVTADFDPETVGAAPTLKVEACTGLGSYSFSAPTMGSTQVNTIAENKDIIIIDLGTNLGTADPSLVDKRCCITVPIVESAAGKQFISAYLAVDDPKTDGKITLDRQISSTIEKTVESNHYYLIQDEINTGINANTPYNLAEQIKSLDMTADRTVNITVNSNITVDDSNTDEHGYVVDLSDYELRNNINVSFKFLSSFVGKSNGTNTLEIRTKANTKGKKLTISVTEGSNKLKAIKVGNALQGALELQGAISAIEAGSKNLTINAAVTTVNATAETNINANGKTITTLNINKGCGKVNLLNGTVTNAQFGVYNDDPAVNKEIDADVEIYTEGNGQITNINYANVPKNGAYAYNLDFAKKVNWTSKWDGASKTNPATKISGIAASPVDAIVSASQLANAANYTSAARILAKEIDLDNKTWASLSALTKGIDGNISVVPNGSSKSVAAVNTQIKNLAGTNGLIVKWTPAAASDVIKNVTFSDANIVQTGTASKIGLLVGEVDNSSAAGTIQDILLTGSNSILGKSNTTVTAIGGVIGKITNATNALTLANIKVESGTTVTGSKYVGGIVGEIAGKVIFAAKGKQSQNYNNIILKTSNTANVVNDDVFNSSAATLTTYKVGSSIYAPNLATKGQFFGGASAVATDGDITILGDLTACVYSDPTSWAYYIPTAEYEYNPWQITNNYAEIGACGFETAAYAVQLVATFKNIKLLTSNGASTPTYATSTNLVPYVGSTDDYASAKAANDYGYGKKLFFSYVNNPE